MSMAAFDTLKFSRRLKDAGIPQEQAEAQSEAIVEAFSQALDTQVATKADIHEVKIEIQEVKADLNGNVQEVKAELQGNIQEVKDDIHRLERRQDEVKTELQGDIQEVKSEQRLMKWMLGVTLGFVVAMFWRMFIS